MCFISLKLLTHNFYTLSDLWDALAQAGRPLSAGGGRSHGGCGLHDCSGHIGHCQRGGGGDVGGQNRERVPDQTQVPLRLNTGVVLCCQLEHLETVVVEPWNLTLEGPILVVTANFNGCLAVKDGQLSPWSYTDIERARGGKKREENSGADIQKSHGRACIGTSFEPGGLLRL